MTDYDDRNGELGKRIGCRIARAIGQALHRNPFAPDVPCHRVIKSDGSLGGYAFGAEKKAELLKKESSSVSPTSTPTRTSSPCCHQHPLPTDKVDNILFTKG